MADESPANSSKPADDPRWWRFDSANPPEVWTKETAGRLRLGQIEQLADPANGLLSEASQASFDEAHRQLNEELAANLKPAIDKMLPSLCRPC